MTCAGPLPKKMPPSLETLQLGPPTLMDRGWKHPKGKYNKFTGGIPAEWGSLSNLKQLNLMECGLDGACS